MPKTIYEPAPEYGAWSTQGDGSGHTYDITGTDGSGKGCGEGSELGDIASGILVLLEGQRYRLENLTLWKAQANRQENVGSQQQDDHRPPPKERTEGCEKFVDCFHVNLSLNYNYKIYIYFSSNSTRALGNPIALNISRNCCLALRWAIRILAGVRQRFFIWA